MEQTLKGLRLLLVEDEFVLALGLADLLEDLGAIVLGPVASVDDALALLREVPEIDAAVLDVNVGSELVYPVADALLARNVPFFFSTAQEPARMPERFRSVPLCPKPFDAQRFRDALAHLRPAHLPAG
ncbi:MAG TPA: response regulator [Lysobacter sp.]